MRLFLLPKNNRQSSPLAGLFVTNLPPVHLLSSCYKMPEAASSSAAVLRDLCTSVAQDIAHAPLKSGHYIRLTTLTKQMLALERTMATTSEQVGHAIAHANELTREAATWRTLAERGTLAGVLDGSMRRVAGGNVAEKRLQVDHGEVDTSRDTS